MKKIKYEAAKGNYWQNYIGEVDEWVEVTYFTYLKLKLFGYKVRKQNEVFKMEFDADWFKKNDILISNDKYRLKIISTPKRKWYHRLLQFITFGIYRAGWYYRVEKLNKDI